MAASSSLEWPCQGLLQKRKSPKGGTLVQRYCVFCGPLFLEYELKEHFDNGLPPKVESELIGVAPWEGSRGGFIIVTRLGGQSFCVASSVKDRERWTNSIMRCLNSALLKQEDSPASSPRANPPIGRLEREVMDPPRPKESDFCMRSGQAFGLTLSKYQCSSCGDACSFEYCAREIPLTHYGSELALRVCDRCYLAQQIITHLKILVYTFQSAANDFRQMRLGNLAGSGKSLPSSSLKAGFALLQKKSITREEFGELVRAEQSYQVDEAVNSVRMERMAMIERLGDDTLGLIKLLHDSAQSERFNLLEFMRIVQDLHELAEADLDSIDFYWPQLVHTHNLMLPAMSLEAALKVELLEDFMLYLCIKSPHLAVRTIWWLKGSLEDIASSGVDVGDAPGKQVNIIRLAMEVENVVILASPNWSRGNVEAGSVIRSLLQPTGVQSSLLADQMLLLREARGSMSRERNLAYRAKLQFLPGSEVRGVGNCVGTEDGTNQQGVSPAYYFEAQLRFVQALIDIAEKLRFVEPISSRGEELEKALSELEGERDSNDRIPGFLPVCGASDPICPIVRIPAKEGHVFKTKARAPTLITCEIIVDGEKGQQVDEAEALPEGELSLRELGDALLSEELSPRSRRIMVTGKDEISLLIDQQVATGSTKRDDELILAQVVNLPDTMFASVAVRLGFLFVDVEMSELAHVVQSRSTDSLQNHLALASELSGQSESSTAMQFYGM